MPDQYVFTSSQRMIGHSTMTTSERLTSNGPSSCVAKTGSGNLWYGKVIKHQPNHSSMIRRILFAFFASPLIVPNTHAQVPSYVPTNGLVGWWPFNNNANDESGNSNHGAVTGCLSVEDRFGTPNSAYSFNGAEYITIANSLLPSDPTSFSISVWFNTNTNDGMIISDRGTNINWFKYMVGIADNVVKAGNYSPGCNSGAQTINSIFVTGQWNHIVDIKNYEDGTHKLYLNGVMVAQEALLCYHASNNGTSIGRWVGITTDGYYEGLIDDIGVWDRALSETEIMELYDVASPVAEDQRIVSMMAYPNPTTGSTRITNIPQGTAAQLFDATGRNLPITALRQGTGVILDLSSYPAGLYFVRAGDRSFSIVRE